MVGKTSRRKRSGVTILEIMVAFSLLSVVIVAFATVFPSGYKLNLSNLNQNQAASLANGLAEIMRAQSQSDLDALAALSAQGPGQVSAMMTFADVDSGLAIIPAQSQLAIDSPGGTAANGTTIPFFVPSGSKTFVGQTVPQGIQVTKVVDPSTNLVNNYNISVTVCWIESRKNTNSLLKSVSLSTMATNAFFPVSKSGL